MGRKPEESGLTTQSWAAKGGGRMCVRKLTGNGTKNCLVC